MMSQRARLFVGLIYIVISAGLNAIVGAPSYAQTSGLAKTESGLVALIGATILVGPDLEPLQNGTILIDGGRIASIGRADEVVVPNTAERLNLAGHTVLPGLIDMHVHLGAPGTRTSLSDWPLHVLEVHRYAPLARQALLAHGVTSVRSLGDGHEWITQMRRMIADHELEGPRIFAAGPVFTTRSGHPIATHGVDPDGDVVRLPASPEEAREMVRNLAQGEAAVDLIKVIQERGGPRLALDPLPADILQAIVSEAHAHGLRVVAHCGTADDMRDVIAAGVDGIEHLERRAVREGWPADVLKALIAADISLNPTLTVTSVALPESEHAILRGRLLEYVEQGGRIVAGSDAGMPQVAFGESLHRKLELLVASGISPLGALRAATSDAAYALGNAEIGAIETGRIADLLVVLGEPHSDILAIRNVRYVYLDGRVVHVAL